MSQLLETVVRTPAKEEEPVARPLCLQIKTNLEKEQEYIYALSWI